MKTHVLAPDPVHPGFPGVLRAGPLLFTADCDGHRGRSGANVDPRLFAEAEQQCDHAYGRLVDLLAQAGSGPSAIVRLDHATSSQDWLPRRQSVRQKYFGRPAPLASTGIAARLDGLNMLAASAIAVADPADKAVLVPGPKYGMHNISSVVRGGPFLFVSGIRGNVDPRSGQPVEEESPAALGGQLRLCWDLISAILAEAGAGPSRILRVESYIRERRRAGEAEAAREAVLGAVVPAVTTVALPLGARGEAEVTVLAAAPGVPIERPAPGIASASGLHFIGRTQAADGGGDWDGECERVLDALQARLALAGSGLDRLARLDVLLADIYRAPDFRDRLRRRLGAALPTLHVMGADLERAEIALSAIAA